MKINFKFIVVLLICIVAFPCIVSAFPNYSFTATYSPISSATQQFTYNNGGGAGHFINRTLTLGSYKGNLLNLGSLTSVDTGIIDIGTSSSQGSWISGNYPANIYSPYQGTLLGVGQISISYVSNSSSTAALYDINLNSIVWNSNIKTYALPSGNPASEQLNISYTADSGMLQYKSTSVTNIAISGTAGLIYYQASGGSFPYIGVSNGNYMTNTFTYNFINQVNIGQTVTGYTYFVGKGDGSAQDTGYSYVNITDGSGGVPYPTALGAANISGLFYNVPVFINIQDPQTNYIWNFTAFYPTYNLTAPILDASINTPLSLSLRGSNPTNPADLNQMVIDTNMPNSITGSNVLYDNNATQRNPLNFYKKSGSWYQSDGTGFNINVGATLPTTFSTIFFTSGKYIVYSILSSTIKGGFAAANNLQFNITGSTSPVYAYFTVNDQRTGSIISNSIIGLLDVPNLHWTNYTLAAGTLLLNLQPNYYYAYQALANNYIPSAYTSIYFTGNQTVPINLLPSTLNIVTGNTTLSVTAEDSGTYAPISGATVSVSNTNQTSGYAYSQSLVTSSSGLALFTVPNNQVYTVNVQATGYQAGSSIVSVGTNEALSLIYLTHVSAIPTVTSIITVQTTVPLGIGNSTPGSSGICSVTMPSSFVGAIKNFLVCEGVTTEAGENIICAIGLLMVLLYVGGRYGGGLGAVIGAASGYVMDLLIGWLPLWTLIAFIVIAALILSAKIFLSSE